MANITVLLTENKNTETLNYVLIKFYVTYLF